MEVCKILLSVSATTKKNEKESILLENKGNPLLKEVFRLAYSPTINFWMKQKLEYLTKNEYSLYLEDVLPQLEKISSRSITGNEAKEYVSGLLSMTSPVDAQIVEDILKGSLRCGVGVATINKVWKGLIVKPPRMGAKSMNEKSLKALKGKTLAIELKSDGSYIAANGTLLSRNGNPIEVPCLEEHINCGAFEGFALEGEGIFDLTKANREEGNGIVGKIIKNTATVEEQEGLIYQVWDCIDTDYYSSKGKYNIPNSERRESLEIMFREYHFWCANNYVAPKIQLIPRTEFVTLEEANKVFEGYVRDGFEGAILKDMNAGWSDNGKPSCCVKLKRKDNADLLVVDIYEGEGEAKGTLGGVRLESEEGIIKVGAGSGFNDEQRKLFWDNPNLILGKIVELEYDSVTTDKKTLQKSLFLPIFKLVRDDKLEADSYEEILAKVRIKTK